MLIFGAKRLPEIGKGIGGAIREFKKVKKELSSDTPEKNKASSHSEGAEPEVTTTKIEQKVKDKVLEQVPGVKKVIDAKKKVDKVKDIVK